MSIRVYMHFKFTEYGRETEKGRKSEHSPRMLVYRQIVNNNIQISEFESISNCIFSIACVYGGWMSVE